MNIRVTFHVVMLSFVGSGFDDKSDTDASKSQKRRGTTILLCVVVTRGPVSNLKVMCFLFCSEMMEAWNNHAN